ncbi:hypothetical protein LZ31DRAFT_627371 [Colletotrichum somersetense]|nr:hypothetical protein LZ31DRAFT_627371 [Colletotrichum somersetense]
MDQWGCRMSKIRYKTQEEAVEGGTEHQEDLLTMINALGMPESGIFDEEYAETITTDGTSTVPVDPRSQHRQPHHRPRTRPATSAARATSPPSTQSADAEIDAKDLAWKAEEKEL